MTRWMLLAVALVVAAPRAAWPCSISAEPGARVYGPADRLTRGHRPWIKLWNVPRTTIVTLRSAGKPVAIDRAGNFLRPKQALPSGATVEILAGKKVLSTFEVVAGDPQPLPAWSGLAKLAGGTADEGLCSPAGPVISTTIAATRADLSDAVLLVYLKKPDAKRPHANLAAIYRLGATGDAVVLQSSLADRWLAKLPAKLWTALANNDGEVGPIEEHALR